MAFKSGVKFHEKAPLKVVIHFGHTVAVPPQATRARVQPENMVTREHSKGSPAKISSRSTQTNSTRAGAEAV